MSVDVSAAATWSALGTHRHTWRHVKRVGWFCWLCPQFSEQQPQPQTIVDPFELAEAERARKLDHILDEADRRIAYLLHPGRAG